MSDSVATIRSPGGVSRRRGQASDLHAWHRRILPNRCLCFFTLHHHLPLHPYPQMPLLACRLYLTMCRLLRQLCCLICLRLRLLLPNLLIHRLLHPIPLTIQSTFPIVCFSLFVSFSPFPTSLYSNSFTSTTNSIKYVALTSIVKISILTVAFF